MEKDLEYRQRIIAEYKEAVMPLLRYLPWLEQHAGKSVSATYQGDNIGEGTLKFPVYDGTLMNFVREASKSSLMEKNYQYVFTRNRLKTHEDERKAIIKAGWREWDLLKGILSKYVLGGRVKGTLWNEAMQEEIFYLTLKQMKEIIEFWDQPIYVQGNV